MVEILVTMAVIGLVVAMTIAVVIPVIQNQSLIAGYKKAYGSISNAFITAKKDDLIQGFGDRTLTPSTRLNNFVVLKNQFKVLKTCFSNNNSDCWADAQKFGPGGSYPASDAYAFLDVSGMAYTMPCSPAGNTCEEIIAVDTNAFKLPNQFGKDRFIFQLADFTNTTTLNMPVKIKTLSDRIAPDDECPGGNCLYRTWIFGE